MKMSENGLGFMTAGGSGHLDSQCQNLVDPLGAGDQFIAALAYQRCLGNPWVKAIEWANVAAGLQCEHRGCKPLTVDEIEVRLPCQSAA
jgi:sugar/nucleoside kinase (ribokinase family)